MARINDLIKNENQTVKWVKDRYTEGNLFVDNSFQRRYVWLKKHQVNLIETILMGYVIPEIYIWEVGTDPESGETKYSIVDGQQRIGAIVGYVSGKFPLYTTYLSTKNSSYAGKYFSELSDEDKMSIWGYSLSFRKILSEVSREDIVNLFLRLNSTDKSLNPQELRNAEYNGLFLQNAISISTLPFWDKFKIFSVDSLRRMGDVEFISSILIFLRKGIDSEITQAAINQIYDLYNEEYDEAEDDKNTVKKILDVIEQIIEQDGGDILLPYIKKTTHLYTIFTVIYKTVSNNKDIDKKTINKLISFYKDYETGNDKHVNEYRDLYQEGTRSKQNRIKRTKILANAIG